MPDERSKTDQEIVRPGRYRHFKGGEYEVIGVARDSETEQEMVVYRALYGERGTGQLLILSQVILSLQLSFAVVPLVQFTSEKAKMGPFANSRTLKLVAWMVTAIIIVFNGYLLVQTFFGG